MVDSIRRYIPHFIYVYGYDNFLIENNKQLYLITDYKERNLESVSFNKISQSSNKNLKSILIQIFITLYFAQMEFGFRHNNLKCKSIKIERYMKPIEMSYIFGKNNISMSCNYIAYIDDFENATFDKKEMDYKDVKSLLEDIKLLDKNNYTYELLNSIKDEKNIYNLILLLSKDLPPVQSLKSFNIPIKIHNKS